MQARSGCSAGSTDLATGSEICHIIEMSSAADKAVEAIELLPEDMREPAADYLLSEAKKFKALKDAVDEGIADVYAGRVVPWDFKDILRRAEAMRSVSGQADAAGPLEGPGTPDDEWQVLRRRESAHRLAEMGGTAPDAEAPPRRRIDE